jgi:hypothetical protein
VILNEGLEMKKSNSAFGFSVFGLLLMPVLTFSCGSQGGSPAGPVSEVSLKTFSDISANVFQPKCVRCHNASLSKGNVDLSSYNSIVSNAGLVVPAHSEQSRIFNEVQSGAMPDGGPPLSAAEVKAIGDWITAGAPQS